VEGICSAGSEIKGARVFGLEHGPGLIAGAADGRFEDLDIAVAELEQLRVDAQRHARGITPAFDSKQEPEAWMPRA
jgi:hypothetical protein